MLRHLLRARQGQAYADDFSSGCCICHDYHLCQIITATAEKKASASLYLTCEISRCQKFIFIMRRFDAAADCHVGFHYSIEPPPRDNGFAASTPDALRGQHYFLFFSYKLAGASFPSPMPKQTYAYALNI